MPATSITVQIRHPDFVVGAGLRAVLCASAEFEIVADTPGAPPAAVLLTD
jgi:hypothetical protein